MIYRLWQSVVFCRKASLQATWEYYSYAMWLSQLSNATDSKSTDNNAKYELYFVDSSYIIQMVSVPVVLTCTINNGNSRAVLMIEKTIY